MTEPVDPQTEPQPAPALVKALIPCKFCGQDIVDRCAMIDATALVASIASVVKGLPVTVSGTILLQMQPVACHFCRRPYADVRSTSERVLPASALPLIDTPRPRGGNGG